MSRRMFEFKCSEGHLTEALVVYETTQVLCECGLEANRIISTPRICLDGTNPNFVSAYDRWARVREEKAKQEAKSNAA
jgi:hypothetical protein